MRASPEFGRGSASMGPPCRKPGLHARDEQLVHRNALLRRFHYHTPMLLGGHAQSVFSRIGAASLKEQAAVLRFHAYRQRTSATSSLKPLSASF